MTSTTTEEKKATYSQDLKQFSGATVQILKVYPHELFGFYKVGGKNVVKTYTQFPVVPQEVLVQGSEEIKALPKYEDCGKLEYREKVWEDGTQKFLKVDQKSIDRKVFKKTFGIKMQLPEAKTIVKYTPKGGEDVTEDNDVVTVTNIGASKVKDLLRCFKDNIPMISRDVKEKDADGNFTGKVNTVEQEEWDFEDTFKNELEGVFVKIKTVKATMMIDGETKQVTKFNFSEGKPFSVVESGIKLSDIPFEF